MLQHTDNIRILYKNQRSRSISSFGDKKGSETIELTQPYIIMFEIPTFTNKRCVYYFSRFMGSKKCNFVFKVVSRP